jgi:hypothetical protein
MSYHLVTFVAAKVTVQQMPPVPASLRIFLYFTFLEDRGKNKKHALFNNLCSDDDGST